MFCTQCGCKIEDGFKFCPECGKVIKEIENVLGKSIETLEDIMLDVAKRYPPNSAEAIGELSRKTGIKKMQLGFVMASVWDGRKPSELRDYQSMEKKYQTFIGKGKGTCCPKCGSDNIQYKHGNAWAYSGDSITMIEAPRLYLRCIDCGKQWAVKPNQWKYL